MTSALDHIQQALAQTRAEPRFADAAMRLLNELGYKSGLTPPDQPEDPARWLARTSETRTKRDFLQNAASMRVLFQITDSEIRNSVQPMLGGLLSFDGGNASSFLFAAVDLSGERYPRGRLAAFAREINKAFPMPCGVIFRASDGRLTFAFAHRRTNLRHADRDVIGNVSLIREINPESPHRAHLDILAELSLDERLKWMDSRGKSPNFDGLLDAWLAALDTETLNKAFYKDLFEWFQRAVRDAKFPDDKSEIKPEEHAIRLITRMLFVWFAKEKGLVDENLFIENNIAHLLRDYDSANGDSYYRAVLQNLFFATLNTDIEEREFSKVEQRTHRDFSKYRYRDLMADSDALIRMFERTPFINGGLFDCLDSFEGYGERGYRIDCFTDRLPQRRKLSVPNRLFFDEKGLIPLFERYKFTVEENTPTETEVALDPELLGKAFENLLAANTPETRESARKQTGSYYTPRPVVDYMADEALSAAISRKAAPPDAAEDSDSAARFQDRLRRLFDYADAMPDAETLFSDSERRDIVDAIAELKILDPAVGSGAFPMSVLHKLTLALRRLDPRNELWEDVQRELAGERAKTAFNMDDRENREDRLSKISKTFERYKDSDYGRKLYLIQNSVFGVDIQPIATQIAKLRFFISLAIEQTPNEDEDDNYGIEPLPNLETRFIAANSLIGLEGQGVLPSVAAEKLQHEIRENREDYFLATTRTRKRACRKKDDRLRQKLAAELTKMGFPKRQANRISVWDPYDQNAKSDWFDPEYMFGVADGFDVVIGNPPYKQVRKGIHSAVAFPYSEGMDRGKQNFYKLFVEQSYNLLRDGGSATMIVHSGLMCDLSSAATRQLLLERTRLRHIVEFPERASNREAQVFGNVTQSTCIYQFDKLPPNDHPIKISIGNDAHSVADLQFTQITGDVISTLWPDLRYIPFIRDGSFAILSKVAADKTVKPLRHYADSIHQGDLNLTTHSGMFSNSHSPVLLLRGRQVGRFVVRYDDATEYCEAGFMPDKVRANRTDTFLISQAVRGAMNPRRLVFALTAKSSKGFLWGHSVNKTKLKNQSHSKAFLALLNSKFMDWFFRLTSSNNNVQGYELQQLPIPNMSGDDRKRLTELVDRILTAKDADPRADTSGWESEIDSLVHALYGLSAEETAAIERG